MKEMDERQALNARLSQQLQQASDDILNDDFYGVKTKPPQLERHYQTGEEEQNEAPPMSALTDGNRRRTWKINNQDSLMQEHQLSKGKLNELSSSASDLSSANEPVPTQLMDYQASEGEVLDNQNSALTQQEPFSMGDSSESDRAEVFEDLDHLTKTKVNYEIMSNTIIPFDKAEFIQSIENPLNRNQILTVQIVIPAQGKYLVPKLKCLFGHKLQKGKQASVFETEQLPKCILCSERIQSQATQYQCPTCALSNQQFQVCERCKLRHYVRRKLLKNPCAMEHYHLKATIEQAHGSDSDNDRQRLSDLGELATMPREQTIRFANVVKTAEESDPQVFEKHAKVTLWNDKHEIYQSAVTFTVAKPACLRVRYSKYQVLSLLLHESLSELFYFTKPAYTMNLVDLASLQEAKDRLPLKQQIDFSQEIQQLLHPLFHKSPQQIVVKALLQLIKRQDKLYLIVTADLERHDGRWVRSQTNNVILISLDESKIVSVLLDVKCFVSFRDDELTVLRDNSIDVIKWTAPVLIDLSQPAYKSYSIMLPLDGSKFYSYQMKNFRQWLAEANMTGCLVSAKHHDVNKVTVIYQQKGVLRMSLQRADPKKRDCNFRGHIGKLRDFQLFNLNLEGQTSIKQKGSDVIGNYTLYGKVHNKSWRGYQQDQQTDTVTHLRFDRLQFIDGLMEGMAKGTKFVGVYFLNQCNFKLGQWTFKGTHLDNAVDGEYYDEAKRLIGTFHIQKDDAYQVEIDINYTDDKWIHLQGEYIASKNQIQGQCSVAPVLAERVTLNGQYTDFQLINISNNNSADVTFKNNDLKDAQFCYNIECEDAVQICGNLIIRTQTSTFKLPGFKSLNLSLYDMSHDKPEPNTLLCHMVKSFNLVSTDLGTLEPAPYTLMPFRLNRTNDFIAQIFFHDTLQNLNRVVFIRGKPRTELMKNDRNGLPQEPPEVNQNYIVVYPILAHKSQLYTDDEIVVCNSLTMRNKSVNLAPFTFVQFMDMGLVPEQYIEPHLYADRAVNTSIFMLVQFRNRFYVMVYRCFPWPVSPATVDESFLHRFQFQDQIQLLNGDINLSEGQGGNVQQSELRSDNIASASMFQVQKQNDVLNIVVLQMMNQILTFKLNKAGSSCEQVVPDQHKMLQIKMQVSQNNDIFYVEKDRTNTHTLIEISPVASEKIQRRTIYKSTGVKILSIQLEYRSRSQNQESPTLYLFVLFANQTFKRIVIGGDRDNYDSRDVDLVIDLSGHPSMRSVLSAIRQQRWATLVMNEKGVIILKAKEEGMEAVLLSTKSDLNYALEFPGLHHDYQLAQMRKHGRDSKVDVGSQVLLAAEIAWIDKHLFQINEGKKSYFLITQHTCRNQIDMTRIDTDQTVVEDVVLLGNSYVGLKLMYTNQYMLFRQSNFSFARTLAYKQLRHLSHCQSDVQYVLGIQQENKHSVLKIVGGQIEVILADALAEIDSVSKRALLQRKSVSFNDLQYAFDFESEEIYYYAFLYERSLEVEPGPDFSKREILGNSILVGLSFIEVQNMSTLALIWSEEWRASTEHRDVIFSKDFMIIQHGRCICFTRKASLQTDQRMLLAQINLAQTYAAFTLINTQRCPELIASAGVKLTLIEASDMVVVSRNRTHRNLLQISFSTLSVAWDLDTHEEVMSVDELSDFDNQSNFVVTGFKPHLQHSLLRSQMNSVRFFSQNERRSLLLTPSLERKNPVLFRTYTYINMIDVLEIQKKERFNLFVGELDFETVLQNIDGMSFFEVFIEGTDYLNQLIGRIKDQQLVNQVRRTANGKVLDHMAIRRLYWTINLPLMLEKGALPELNSPSIVHYAMFFKPQSLDLFLTLMLMSRERKVQNLISNFKCLQKVYSVESQLNWTFIGDSFSSNIMTEEVSTLPWKPGEKLLTFGSKTSLYSAQDIRRKVAEEQYRKTSWLRKLQRYLFPWLRCMGTVESQNVNTQVEVKIISVEWLYAHQKDFYYYLAEINDTKVYENELINILLLQQDYSGQLITKFFVPQLIFTVVCLYYFSFFLPTVKLMGSGFFTQRGALARVLILVLALFNLSIEFRQMRTQRLAYLTDQWNYVVLWANFLSLFIIFQHSMLHTLSHNYLIIVGSVAVIFQWVSFFAWLRLFPGFAFYVTMIIEVIKSLKYFMMLFTMLVLMMANAFYAINQIGVVYNRDEDRVYYNVMYQKATEWPFFDSCIMIFRMVAKNFKDAKENFTAHPAAKFAWAYFFFSSLLVLIFVTMIVAIVNDTYSQVQNKSVESAKLEQTQMYRDFMWSIKLTTKLKGQRYLYVVQPKNDSQSEDKIQQAQDNIVSKLKSQFQSRQEKLDLCQAKMMQLVAQQSSLNLDLKEKLQQLNKLLAAGPGKEAKK